MAKVNKDMLIGEILQLDPNMAVGCPSSQAESLEEASMVHGLPVDLVVARLNAYLESVGK